MNVMYIEPAMTLVDLHKVVSMNIKEVTPKGATTGPASTGIVDISKRYGIIVLYDNQSEHLIYVGTRLECVDVVRDIGKHWGVKIEGGSSKLS